MSDITVDSTWVDVSDGDILTILEVYGIVLKANSKNEGVCTILKPDLLQHFKPISKEGESNGVDMVNHPPHYKDASGIECIEVTQHMRFCEGSSFYYVYQAGSKGSLIEDLKTAAWYAERSWKRNKCRNNRVHWLVQRKGEAIADSRDKQGKTFIADVMRNIVNNRWWQAYDALLTEIARLESEVSK